jgi:hypothetical protein
MVAQFQCLYTVRPEKLRKSTRRCNQDSSPPHQDLNPVTPTYKAAVSPFRRDLKFCRKAEWLWTMTRIGSRKKLSWIDVMKNPNIFYARTEENHWKIQSRESICGLRIETGNSRLNNRSVNHDVRSQTDQLREVNLCSAPDNRIIDCEGPGCAHLTTIKWSAMKGQYVICALH